MPIVAALNELIDALEEQSDQLYPFLDRETGEVFLFPEESMSLAEAEPEEIEALHDWQREEAELAKRIATTERYLPLPDRIEVNEWNIMRDFCEQVTSDKTRDSLLDAIHGKRSFRRFKDQIAYLDLWEPWNQFRRAALEDILRPWCEENGITLRAGTTQPATQSQKHA